MKSIKNIDSVCRSNQYKTIGFWATKSIEKVSKIQGKINSTINTNTQKPPSKNHVLLLFLLSCDLHALHAADLWARPARWKKHVSMYMQQTFGQGLPGWNMQQDLFKYMHAARLWARPARVKQKTTTYTFFHMWQTFGQGLPGFTMQHQHSCYKATCASCPFGKDTIHQCCFWC